MVALYVGTNLTFTPSLARGLSILASDSARHAALFLAAGFGLLIAVAAPLLGLEG